jgi:hypothetical protein
VPKTFKLICVDSPMNLTCAQTLFGITFGIGTINRALKSVEPSVRMHHGDVVSMVDVE